MKMKMKTKMFFLVIFILILTSCNPEYVIEKNKVYYKYWNSASGNHKELIEKADAKSFQKIKVDDNSNLCIGKDKNSIYIDGKPMRNIDPKTFKYLGNNIFSDIDSVYFFGFYNDINHCSIKGIDNRKIKLIEYPWSKAENILIHGKDTLTINDISSFTPINNDWGKTKNYIIYKTKIIIEADLKTFEIVNSYTAKDKNHTYELGDVKNTTK